MCSVVDTMAIASTLKSAQKTRDSERFDVSSRRSSCRPKMSLCSWPLRPPRGPLPLAQAFRNDERAVRASHGMLLFSAPTGTCRTAEDLIPPLKNGSGSCARELESMAARALSGAYAASRRSRWLDAAAGSQGDCAAPPPDRQGASAPPWLEFRARSRVWHGPRIDQGRESGPIGDRRDPYEETAQ